MSPHPCNNYSCPDCVGGQCFAGGCKLNPTRRSEDNEDNESEEEDNG